MKRLFNRLPLFIGIVLVLVTLFASLIAGCKSGTGPVALTVVNGNETKTFTVAQLEKLPSISGTTGDISSTGTIEGPSLYKGVPLTDILKAVGGITPDEAITISAKDGYSMTMSYNQVEKGTEFPTFDTVTGKEVTPDPTMTVFMAYEKDGTLLDDTVGPLRLGIMASNELTDGHWWVKWAETIEIITVPQPTSTGN